MTPTPSHLQTLFPKASPNLLDYVSRGMYRDLLDFNINSDSPNRLPYFLAQLGHESGGLTILEENLSYSAERLTKVWPTRFPNLDSAQPYARNPEKLANLVYANRMGNGPPESGDGWRFRGRGLIQLTGREAYHAVGVEIGLNLVGQPEFASAPVYALRVACGYWSWKKLNPICDKGDFVELTRRINGGQHGLDDRLAWLDKVRRTLSKQPTVEFPTTTVIEVQKALRSLGFTNIGAADGLIGPRTMMAIASFRHQHGLQDGGVDDTLLAALEVEV